MTAKASIAAWLAEYQSDLLGRALTPAERMLAEEVLLNLLLDEPTLQQEPAHDVAQHALAAIQTLVAPKGAAACRRLAATIQGSIENVTSRLERQEHANLIMREHLSMLTTPPPDGPVGI